MVPLGSGIWKMHPPGLRLYGWFPAKKSFVAVTAALEIETKQNKGLNDQKMQQVAQFIQSHGLASSVIVGDILNVFPPEG